MAVNFLIARTNFVAFEFRLENLNFEEATKIGNFTLTTHPQTG